MSSAGLEIPSEVAASASNLETYTEQHAQARKDFCEQSAREQLMDALTKAGRLQDSFPRYTNQIESEYRQAAASEIREQYEKLSSELPSLIRDASVIEGYLPSLERSLAELLARNAEKMDELELLGAEPDQTLQEYKVLLEQQKQTRRVRELHLDTLAAKSVFLDALCMLNSSGAGASNQNLLARQRSQQMEAQSMETYPVLLEMLES